MAKAHKIYDNFNGSAINSGLWLTQVAGTGTITQGSGIITITPQNSTTGGNYLYSKVNYDLSGSSIRVKVSQVANANCDTGLMMWYSSGNYLVIFKDSSSSNIVCGKVVGGSWTQAGTAVYNSSTHAYWQIRESGGTTYFDTSSDGLTYTNLSSNANPFDVTSLQVDIYVDETISTASPGSAQFDDLNVPPISTPGNSFRSISVGNGMSRNEGAT